MSQDLLASFGVDASKPGIETPSNDFPGADQSLEWTQSWSSETKARAKGATHNPEFISSRVSQDDDEEFGDFEDASTQREAQGSLHDRRDTSRQAINFSSVAEGAQDSNPKTSTSQHAPPSAKTEEQKKQSAGRHPFAGNMSLLFEAGEDEYDAGDADLADLSTNPEAAMAFSKRIIAEQQMADGKKQSVPATQASNGAPSSHSRSNSKPQPQVRNKLRKKSAFVPVSADVLFDADDAVEDEADEFGDFEEVKQPQRQSNSSSLSTTKQVSGPASDLLGLDERERSGSGNTECGSRNSDGSEMLGQPSMSDTSVAPIPTVSLDQMDEEEAWDDFETAPAPSPMPSPVKAPTSASRPELSNRNNRSLPPPNVPPPVVLISIFPSLFAAADDALFTVLGKLDVKQRGALLAHPASHQFLKGFLAHCAVLARIVAGRKLRWKRDQHLSQSMRIGPAAAGGKGGMKLAGLDKAEVQKEDREVVDILRVWRNQVGKLRTAVSTASSTPSMPKLPSIPEIAEQMPIKALKVAEGGITAPHACAVCGIKREERVRKVDTDVLDDGFGEWWVQGLDMHRACLDFWDEFEKKLKSR